MIGIFAGVALLVLAAGGIGVGFALSALAQGDPSEQAAPVVVAPERSASSTPTGSPSPAASEAPITVPDLKPTVIRQFKSPSGNIRCSIEELRGATSVTCQQPNINYAVPAQACSAGAEGVAVAVNDNGTFWPCLSANLEPSEILQLDTPLTENGMHCSIGYDTGVTCANPSGRGFTMEYDRGVRTF